MLDRYVILAALRVAVMLWILSQFVHFLIWG